MRRVLTREEVASLEARRVHEIISSVMLADGFDLVCDLSKSKGVYLYDAREKKWYLDMFSFFASQGLGFNHPKMREHDFLEKLTRAAVMKPSNSDIYTVEMAQFVATFNRVALPKHGKHLFLISGGALAVENALKAAFDWKVQKNYEKGYNEERGHKVLHFREAFHGRTGYTLSLTNTDPVKIRYFPKFDWPRVVNPKITFPLEEHLDEVKKLEAQAIDEIHSAFKENPDDIAAIIIEPIQCEGGDNHFRAEFLQKLREIADENEAMLIFDEVQTGGGITGTMWSYEQLGVEPDIFAFGKKLQVCGIVSGSRIDEVTDNVFTVSSRINSTWGGNLVDMVRSQRFLEIVEEENLLENARVMGEFLLDGLREIETEFPFVSNARGRGLLCSFDLDTPERRDATKQEAYRLGMIILPCGVRSIRFRPVLDVEKSDIERALAILRETLTRVK